MSASPTVSFVIPVRNDGVRLRRCLQAIVANARHGLFEVLVADNGSTDNSRDVARECGATVLSLPGLRVSELRNRAAALASAPILAFVDADNEIGPAWVQSVTSLLAGNSRVAAVGGQYHPPTDSSWIPQTYDTLRQHPRSSTEVDWLGSGNLAVRRSVFVEIGGFDTALETCEDIDFCRKMRAKELTLIADVQLHSIHHGDPRTLRALFVGELWRGRDNLRVGLRPPRTVRTVIGALIPLAHLVGLCFLFGSVVLLPGHLFSLSVIMGGIGLVTSGLVVSTRLARMIANRHPDRAVATIRMLLVAWTFELARALALIARTTHAQRRRVDTT